MRLSNSLHLTPAHLWYVILQELIEFQETRNSMLVGEYSVDALSQHALLKLVHH
jgi:hypothetical protein